MGTVSRQRTPAKRMRGQRTGREDRAAALGSALARLIAAMNGKSPEPLAPADAGRLWDAWSACADTASRPSLGGLVATLDDLLTRAGTRPVQQSSFSITKGPRAPRYNPNDPSIPPPPPPAVWIATGDVAEAPCSRIHARLTSSGTIGYTLACGQESIWAAVEVLDAAMRRRDPLCVLRRLRRCALPACGRFFDDRTLARFGSPASYCTPAHARAMRRVKVAENVRRHRARR